MKLAWHCVTEAIYKKCHMFFCNKTLGFLILFGFHMLSNIDGLVVLPEPQDVSAEVVVLGVQHGSTIHFSWEKGW